MSSLFKQYIIFSFLLLGLTSLISEVHAFGKLGHQLVCDIADREFTPETKKEIQALLSVTKYRKFSDACNWPDHIKRQKKYKWARHLHYINIPRLETRVDIGRDCPRGCVLTAITEFSNKFLQSDDPDERAKALMFLGHFVGDIHQPLHVSYADDKGGNTIKMTYKGDRTSLHKVWDSKLISEEPVSSSALGSELFSKISDFNRTQWANNSKNFTTWANESLSITRRIYADLPSSKGLPDNYFRKFNSLVLEQIQKGGIRLGTLLNQLVAERGIVPD